MVIGPFLPKMNANIFRCEAIWFQNCAFKCIHVGGVCVVCVCVCVWCAHVRERERTNMASSQQFSFIYLVVFFQHLFMFEIFLYVGET